MFNRINWKSTLKTIAWMITLAGLTVLMGFVEKKKQALKCSNVRILIPGADNFIEREEIDAILKQSQGALIGRAFEEINLAEIENRIKANPYIAYAKVYAEMNGVIEIEIRQRQPLLRIINANNQDFYVDRNGMKMPVSSNFTANVLVANGDIGERFLGRIDTLSSQLAEDLYKTALYIKDDTLWDAQIEQLFVNERNDIELIPRVGNQRIILGNADSIDVKMGNLMAFYKQAMPKVGWDAYKSINIKYTNQIVCERTKYDSLARVATRPKPVVRDSAVAGRKVMDSIIKNEIIKEIENDPVASKALAKPGTKAVAKPVTKAAEKPVVKPVTKPVVKAAEGVKKNTTTKNK
jgi:cell division protein FtsQ